MTGPLLKVRRVETPWGFNMQFQCPCCKEWMYSTAKSYHITRKGKNEAKKKVAGIIKKTPHYDFYMKHTEEVVETKRVWKVIL